MDHAIELVSLCGTLLATIPFGCVADFDPTQPHFGTKMKVGELADIIALGGIPGVPAAHRDEHGMQLERLVLVLGHSRMGHFDDVLDYFRTKRYVRIDRRITLVRVPFDEVTLMRMKGLIPTIVDGKYVFWPEAYI